MKILILGGGQVGTTLAQSLSLEHDITLVDLDPDCLTRIQNRLDVRTVQGYAADPRVLESAGGEDADMLIAVTSSDEVNMIACQVSYALFNTPTKIARVRGHHFDDYPQLFEGNQLHIDTIINPAELVTERLMRQIEHPGTSVILDFAKGKLQMAAVRATPMGSLCGRKVMELSHDLANLKAGIIGVLRNDETIPASPELVIQAYDLLFYFTTAQDLSAATQALLQSELKYRRIMLAGGGNIGISLAKRLEDNYKVKILEHDPEQCEKAAEQLHHTVVLVGDSADTELLQSESIDEVDMFCSVTNDDEANIMSAIVAKRLGAKTTIALVNRQTYAHFLIERSPDIDIALSPQRITGGKILTYLRKGDIVSLYAFPNGVAEAIEIIVHGDKKASKVVGRTISKIKWPAGSRVYALARGDDIIVAEEDTVIEAGDHLIMVLIDRRSIPQLEKLLSVSPDFL